MGAEHLAERIDQHEAGPRTHGVFLPNTHFGVIHDRMLDAVAQDRLANPSGVLLGIELSRMYADDHEFLSVLLLKALEILQHMHTIDAAVGPEIQQDNLAAKIL